MRSTPFFLAAIALFLLAPSIRAEQSQPTRIPLNPIRQIKYPRTLMGESTTRLPSGAKVKQQLWQWKIPKVMPASQRQHSFGRVTVMRTYKPVKDGTVVQQVVMTKPAGLPRTDAGRAAAALNQVMSMANQLYVEPVDQTKVLRDAMRGVANGLDRHTNYFNPEEFQRLKIHLRGSVVGVGVSVQEKDNMVTVAKTYKGPARHAGVRRGDRLVSVNGQAVTSVNQAAKLLGGEQGSQVKVVVERRGKQLGLTMERQPVDFNPVRTRLTRDGIGYIRLAQFDEGAADKVQSALGKLERRNGGALKGLVFDLRNNPGGSLTEATSILNTFVPKGTLVTTRVRGGVVGETFTADPAKTTHGKLPMTVLINKGSASASELVSGALRDHGRARLVGEKSYGKGTVQHVVPLPDGSGIKMTMARYHLPSGVTPDQQGVTPEITMDQARQRYKQAHPQSKRRIVDYALEEAFSTLRK